MIENPFILGPFKSKEYFCDRERETEDIIRNISNGRNATLISPEGLVRRDSSSVFLKK